MSNVIQPWKWSFVSVLSFALKVEYAPIVLIPCSRAVEPTKISFLDGGRTVTFGTQRGAREDVRSVTFDVNVGPEGRQVRSVTFWRPRTRGQISRSDIFCAQERATRSRENTRFAINWSNRVHHFIVQCRIIGNPSRSSSEIASFTRCFCSYDFPKVCG